MNSLIKNSSGGDNLLIEAKYELRKKRTLREEHVYVWLSVSPAIIEDINTKLITTMLIYTVDIYNRLKESEAKLLSSLYVKMISIYLKEGFPKSMSATEVPSYVIMSYLSNT